MGTETCTEMDAYNQEQVEEFKEAFSMYDTEGNDTIATKDLGSLIRSLGRNADEATLQKDIMVSDPDRTGKIAFDDFLSVMAEKMDASVGEEMVIMRECFEVFDPKKTGIITRETLRHVMQDLAGLDEFELDEVMRECDPKETGHV